MKDKIQRVVLSLSNRMGSLALLACVWRNDSKKWDIVISASWITRSSVKENIGDIFDAFKEEFNGEFALRFSGIYPLATDESFVRNLQSFIGSSTDSVELSDVRINGIDSDKIIVFASTPTRNLMTRELLPA